MHGLMGGGWNRSVGHGHRGGTTCRETAGNRPRDLPPSNATAPVAYPPPARRLQTHPQPPTPLRGMAADPVAAQTAPLAVGPVPPPVHHPQRAVAADRGRRDRAIQPGSGDGHPLPIPGRHDPEPLPANEPCLTEPTVESPVRGDTHAGFGERPEETDRQQCRHRASGRLNQRLDHRFCPVPFGSRLMIAR